MSKLLKLTIILHKLEVGRIRATSADTVTAVRGIRLHCAETASINKQASAVLISVRDAQ